MVLHIDKKGNFISHATRKAANNIFSPLDFGDVLHCS